MEATVPDPDTRGQNISRGEAEWLLTQWGWGVKNRTGTWKRDSWERSGKGKAATPLPRVLQRLEDGLDFPVCSPSWLLPRPYYLLTQEMQTVKVVKAIHFTGS